MITLAIIGVVAAITMPTLIKKYQKYATVTRLKQAYSMLFRAVKMSENDNGPVSEWEIPAGNNQNLVGKEYAQKYIQPYLKNVKICDKLEECLSEKIYYLNGKQASPVLNDYYSLILSNGAVLSFKFLTSRNMEEIVVDLNGIKGPNIVGHDLFFMLINHTVPSDSGMTKGRFYGLHLTGSGLSKEKLFNGNFPCSKSINVDYAGIYCGALIQRDGWKISDDYPW